MTFDYLYLLAYDYISYKNGVTKVPIIDKNIIKNISSKEMDRKDFLKYCGVVLVGLIGFKSVAALLMESSENKKVAVVQPNSRAKQGFGSGSYGR